MPKIGDDVVITGGRRKYVGQRGRITGITGARAPFHWSITLDDGYEGVWSGDEIRVVKERLLMGDSEVDEGVIGEVTHVDDHGSIVIMWVKPKRGKRPIIPINFDRRMFGNMFEQEGGAVEGRVVRVTGDIGNQTVEFID